MFCCFSGRILGGIVCADIVVTLPFISFRILLFFWLHIWWLDIPFHQVLSLSRSYRWSLLVSYLTTLKFAASTRRHSSALLTVVTWRWNRPPQSFFQQRNFGLISVKLFTQRITGTLRSMTRKCTARHYMTSKLVCGVLSATRNIGLVSFLGQ